MTRNTLLNIAISISRILNVMLIIGAIGLTILFVYVQVDNEAFANQDVKFGETSGLIGFSSTESSNSVDFEGDTSLYTIGKLKTVSLYVIYCKGLIVMALVFLSIKAFEKIMLSVKTLQTFSSRNSKLFRDIGKYIIYIVILISYSILRFDDSTRVTFSLSFAPLIYSLLAFIMAEIFKEGSVLKQENELTI